MDPSTSTGRTGGARTVATLPTSPDVPLAWLLGTDEQNAAAALDDLVLEATGRRPSSGSTTVEALPHAMGSPATAGVYRVRGRQEDGGDWSLFCKVLQHVRHWPGLAYLPPDVASHFADTFPWRSELELWDPRVQASLPDGLRSPRLHRVAELPDDRVAIWQEDVAEADVEWDDARYARAAHLLGRWNARSTSVEAMAVSDLPPGFALRMYGEQAVPARGLAPLEDDGLWAHPWLADHHDLRERLRVLGRDVPAMLDRLDTFVQALPHGDASPQNLLVPADDPADHVVIDLSFRSPHALGFDLGQLLVGLVHCDAVPAARLPGIAAAVVPAYVDGVRAEGVAASPDEIADGFATSTLLRSGFDGFLLDELADARPDAPPSPSFTQRIELARFLTDLYDSRPHTHRLRKDLP
ncbi:hypothetical protein [Solicola sp. PLA-1-18]|uniref:hypothetical protein n=1 Tax=Solicola sp. PLA-1-18 TaxID=3380532 RepID=UPI003B80C3B8